MAVVCPVRPRKGAYQRCAQGDADVDTVSVIDSTLLVVRQASSEKFFDAARALDELASSLLAPVQSARHEFVLRHDGIVSVSYAARRALWLGRRRAARRAIDLGAWPTAGLTRPAANRIPLAACARLLRGALDGVNLELPLGHLVEASAVNAYG